MEDIFISGDINRLNFNEDIYKQSEELIWFNEKEDSSLKLEKLLPTNKTKTKLIASVKKDYDYSFLKSLIDSGIRIFRINGAYFQKKEYEKLVHTLEEMFKNRNDKPTIIFDLKGPIPRITKIGGGKNSIEVKKDQVLKIVQESPKIDEPDIIQVDKKIVQCIKVGDKIVIDSSNCILKVIGIDRYKRSTSEKKLSAIKSSHVLAKPPAFDFDENELIHEDDITLFNDTGSLPIIAEEQENAGVFQVDDNLDFSVEERLMHKQTNIKLAYQDIINKHKTYNEFNRINEIDRFSSTTSIDSFKSSEDENKIYLEKRERIRSSIASSSARRTNNMIICEVDHSGSIHLYKKVFLLDKEIVSEMGANPIGVKDIVDLHKIMSLGINIITALVNNADNIKEIKELVGEKVNDLLVFARIETSEAIYNFDSILEKSDGIIIQQGLLSSKIPYEDLCLIEMYIIEKCKIMQKPIFMQTCILKSMTYRVKPLMSEISNIDHAVNVGIDGLILKEEITMAHNHKEIIKLLRETLLQVEAVSDTRLKYEELSKFFKIHREYSLNPTIETILDCSVKTVYDLNIGLIILYTDEYKFAKTLSKFRPNCRIVCVTKNPKTFNYLRLLRGVSPFIMDYFLESRSKIDALTNKIVKMARDRNLIFQSNLILIINANISKDSIYRNGMYFFDTGENYV